MKYFVLLTLFIQTALACEMTFPHRLIVLGHSEPTQIVKTQNCSEESLKDAFNIALTLDGRITNSQFSEILRNKGHKGIKIDPSVIEVLQLKTLIREKLLLPPGIQVKATNGVNISNLIEIAPGDSVEVNCAGCLFGTAQPLNINILGFDGTTKSFVATADFKKFVKAYRLISPLAAFSDINDLSLLKEEYVEAIPHTDLITNLEVLKFYKTNKPLKAGELLRSSDLNALNLVKAGLKTEVILESAQVRIKTQGISRSSGTFGEFVEVFHPQKNKKYQGKVVDINKVLVEL